MILVVFERIADLGRCQSVELFGQQALGQVFSCGMKCFETDLLGMDSIRIITSMRSNERQFNKGKGAFKKFHVHCS